MKKIMAMELKSVSIQTPKFALHCLTLITLIHFNQAQALDLNALPVNALVTAGGATIRQVGNTLNIDQSSQKAAINWQSFNIGANATVNFNQANANAIALNRISGNSASEIYGNLNANGMVFLLNPNGIFFASGSQLNMGGLLATTMHLGDADFMAGNYQFSGNHIGSIINQGIINAAGSIAFLGDSLNNQGQLSATSVSLVSGNTIALNITDDGLIRARIQDTALQSNISNSGEILAAQIMLSSGQAKQALTNVVNNSGIIRATGVTLVNGEIYLEGTDIVNSGQIIAHNADGSGGNIKLMGNMQFGHVQVNGSLDASASITGSGGFIETSAAQVNISDGALVTTASPNGKTGTWLIDPYDFTVSSVTGGNISGLELGNILSINSVTIQTTPGTSSNQSIYTSTTGNGDIFINDPVTWSQNKLTLHADRNIYINAQLTGSSVSVITGNSSITPYVYNASLALEYGQASVSTGNTSTYSINAAITLPTGSNFSTKLGSDGNTTAFTVINSLGAQGSMTATDLQGINGNYYANYALGSDIDASSTSSWNASGNSYLGFNPIGNLYYGQLNGLGHTISGLTINRPTASNVGLIAYLAATGSIRNLSLTGGSITGNDLVGGLVGANEGTISASFSSASVSGITHAGGLVGIMFDSGRISNSYSSGNVSGFSTAMIIGGLLGQNQNGAIINSYAIGNVSGIDFIGGLVGADSGSSTSGTIMNSFAFGSVTGTGSAVGGLVGQSLSVIKRSFWNSSANTNGLAGLGNGSSSEYASEVTGLSSTAMMQSGSYASWNSNQSNTLASTSNSGAVWRIYEGYTTPLLTALLTPLTIPDVSTPYTGYPVNGNYLIEALGMPATGVSPGVYQNNLYSYRYDISGGSLTITSATTEPQGTATNGSNNSGASTAVDTITAVKEVASTATNLVVTTIITAAIGKTSNSAILSPVTSINPINNLTSTSPIIISTPNTAITAPPAPAPAPAATAAPGPATTAATTDGSTAEASPESASTSKKTTVATAVTNVTNATPTQQSASSSPIVTEKPKGSTLQCR